MKKIFCMTFSVFTLNALAQLPAFSITGTPPERFNVEYSYNVKNNAPYKLNGISLYYAPSGETPQGFAQITSGTNACAAFFDLDPGASCTLYYTMDPSQLVNNEAIGGPEICYTTANPIYCSVPEKDSQVDLYYGTASLLGGYYNDSNNSPYLLYSNRPGITWKIASDPVPPIPATSTFHAVASNASLSVAAGPVFGSFPILISSEDNGSNWVSTDLSSLTNGALTFADCAPGTLSPCVVGGVQSSTTPLVFQYNFGSSTWDQQTLPSTGPLYDGACANTYCAVANTNSAQTISRVFYGTLGSWSQYTLPTAGDVPLSSLQAMFCEGDFCIGAGKEFVIISSEYYSYPMITRSFDGITWSFSDLRSLGTINLATFTNMSKPALSCSGSYCLLGGIEGDPSPADIHSKLLESKDYGDTWSEVTALGTVAGASYSDASCSPTICIVPLNKSTGVQFVAQTRDQGITWTKAAIDFPANTFVGPTSCQNDYCLITTHNFNTDKSSVYQTLDAGLTWTLVNFNPALPAELYLYGVQAN